MQPNDPQGLYRPDSGQPQPAQPVQPVQPAPVAQPVQQPVAPVATPAPQPVSAPQQAIPAPAPIAVAAAEPVAAPAADVYEDDADEPDDAPVSWMAHEYIHQEKGTTWFVIFALVVAAFLAISIFLMQSWSFAILLAVIAVVVVLYSRRPPRELTYSLTDDGLMIDDKLHEFDKFKSFGVIRDGEEYSVMLIPTQRFQPGVTVYFPEEYGEDIVDMLGSRLPMKELKLDAVDRVVRLLRL